MANEVTNVKERQLPSYLKEYKGEVSGLKSMDSSDIVIPRIKLLQGTSQEVETYDNAKAGIYWHNMADEPIGSEFDFVVVADAKRYLLVAPINDSRGVLARCDDCVHWVPEQGEFQIKLKNIKNPVTWKLAPTLEESGLHKWGTSNPDDEDSPPAATLFYQYLVVLPDFPHLSPVMLSLTRSQIKAAKRQLNSKIKMQTDAGVPMQALKFKATVVTETGEEGDYYNYQFRSAGFVDEKTFNYASDLAGKFKDESFVAADEAGSVGESVKPETEANSNEF